MKIENLIIGGAISAVLYGIVSAGLLVRGGFLNKKRIENLPSEYNSAVESCKERYIGTFHIHSERIGDKRDTSFYGVDLDNDGRDDIRKSVTPLGRGMTYSEYFDIRK